MQPYYIPYAGYYRLFHEIDLFIIYDDCQISFPGYVHRNRLTNRHGELDWFTIPLRKKALTTEIKDIEFSDNADEKWRKARGHFPIFDQRPLPAISQHIALMMTHKTPFAFILHMMNMTLEMLGMKCRIMKSSQRTWSMFNRGQDRIIEMCKTYGATEYVNASGGKHLYDPAVFDEKGIKLKILQPYQGSTASIFERLVYEDRRAVREEIIDNVRFLP